MKSAFRYIFSLVLAGCVLVALSACANGCRCNKPAPKFRIVLNGSSIYTEDELYDAVLLIKDKFASFTGDCELHSIRYAGDAADNAENLEWLNSLREVRSNIPPEDVGKKYVHVAEFLMDFHSPVEDGPYTWEIDMEYRDYQWWLGRREDGVWEIASWGY